MTRIRNVYLHNWSETHCLPKTLQIELLTTWLLCNEEMPQSDRDIDKINREIGEDFSALRPFTSQKFVYLMNLEELPVNFCDDRNCVVWNYYEETKFFNGRYQTKKLCSYCYGCESKFWKPYSRNAWLRNNIGYSKITRHGQCDAEDLLKSIIHNEFNWCERCIYEPLFDIMCEEACRWEYDYHRKRRKYWVDDSSSDESYADLFGNEVTEYQRGNLVSPDMFQEIVNHPDYDF